MPFNEHMVQDILKLGEAMIFGKELGVSDNLANANQMSPITSNRDSADIVEWLAEDYQNNSALLESLVSEMTNRLSSQLHCGFNTSCTEYVIDTNLINNYAQRAFNDDLINIVSSMHNASALSLSESSLKLAKEIADSENKDSDIESWAKTLANDISKGRD